MCIELLYLFLWDGVAPLFPNGKVRGIWTEQGGSIHFSVAVCMSHVKNCWPSEEHLGSLCLTHSLVVELLEILGLQLVHACARTHMHTDWTDLGQPCCTVTLYWVRKNDTLTVSMQMYLKVIWYNKILWYRYSDLVFYTRKVCTGVPLHLM